jgi:hypothetical protein
VNRAVDAVQIADLELALADARVVPDAGQEFMNGLQGGCFNPPVTSGPPEG